MIGARLLGAATGQHIYHRAKIGSIYYGSLTGPLLEVYKVERLPHRHLIRAKFHVNLDEANQLFMFNSSGSSTYTSAPLT